MLSVYLLLPLISLTVGSPFPDSSSEVDDLGSVSSNTQGWDAFGANALSAVNLPNVDSSQPFSTVSFSDDSLFADEPLSYSGFGSSNLPNALAIAGAGSNDNIFDTTTFDDGLPGGLLDEDGSEDFFELASNPATDGCLSEGNQPYGKRKRLLCPNSETESEAPSRNKDPMLGGGLDQPDVFQKDICMLGFEPVCCTGSDYLGLVQTGCSKYSVSDFKNMDCYDVKQIVCCVNYDAEERTASSCYSPLRNPTVAPLRKLPDFPLNALDGDLFPSIPQPPN